MYGLILLSLLAGIDKPPRPPQAPSIEDRVSQLEQEVAELKARCKCGQTQGSVAVTRAIEVYSPPVRPKVGPVAATVNAAAAVATAPAKVMRQICSGGVCRMVEVDETTTANYSESPNGSCADGSCSQTRTYTRRGWFGRRR